MSLDKTGTLTLNELTSDKPYLAQIDGTTIKKPSDNAVRFTSRDLMMGAYFASEVGTEDPIEKAVRIAAENEFPELKVRLHDTDHSILGFKVTSFIPFNPHAKYTEALVTNLESKEQVRYLKGAPNIITRICGGHEEGDKAVVDLARKGLRALGVAKSSVMGKEMVGFQLIGMISLLDPPRPDSAATIKACRGFGVQVSST